MAEDWLVSIDANRYSVPWRLIGKTVQVVRVGRRWHIRHRGEVVAEHPVLSRPPSAAACSPSTAPAPPHATRARACQRCRDRAGEPTDRPRALHAVEVRDLAVYEQMLEVGMNPAQLERLCEHLLKLRLFKSRERLEALLQQAADKELAYSDFLEQVLGEEVAAKTSKNVTMRTAMARFPFVKPLETFDFGYQPSIDRKQVQTLASCHFIEHGDNVLVLGPPGRGQDPPRASALGFKAIEAGYRVLFTTAANLIATLTKAHAEGRLDEKLKFYTTPRLLIIDEIGYLPIERLGANLFFQLISRRYERGPMILTSNQSFAAWGDVFGDRVIATAILDRLLHHAVTLNIRGNSYRLKEKLKAGLVRSEETEA